MALDMQGLVGHIERRLSGLTDIAPRARSSPPGLAAVPFTLTLEGDYFSIGHQGETFRLKDSLGLRYLARLVEVPGREIHVLELARERSGASDPSELLDQGDAGELLDPEARESYRRRLEDLEATLEEAESFGDAARADKARQEIEFLSRELGRAVGLSGKTRRAGAAAERARSAVQRRLKHALERIGAHSEPLAKFLERSLRTGNYCVFIPVPD